MNAQPHVAFTFKVRLLEDLHAGSGSGSLGIIDDMHARDRRGRPVVWWSTFRGLLREAGEDWLLARRQAGDSEERICDDRRRLYRLFGPPVNKHTEDEPRDRGACVVRSLYTTNQEGDSPFHTWTSTAREVFGRRPMEGSLRTIEVAKAGLVFEGEIRLVPEATEGPEEWPLAELCRVLEACLKRVDAIGGGRTRGWGRIRLEAMKRTELPRAKSPSAALRIPEAAGGMVLRLLLRNLEPLIFARTSYVGNLTSSLSFVPGSSLRGALLYHIGAKDPRLADSLADPAVMSVGNAYCVPAEMLGADEAEALRRLEVLPIPLTIRQFKAGGTPGSQTGSPGMPWWSQPEAPDNRLGASGEIDAVAEAEIGERKRVKREEYLVRRDAAECWQRVKPTMRVLLRNRVPTARIDPGIRGTPGVEGYEDNEQPGFQDDALFSQEVLAEDQCFAVDIRFASAQTAEGFCRTCGDLLATGEEGRPWLRLGRGGTPVRIEAAGWLSPAAPGKPASDRQLVITLTSDMIVRSPELLFVTEPSAEDWLRLAGEACRRCNEEPPAPDATGLSVDTERSFAESAELVTYNAASGLPRTPVVTIKRGSVFVLTAQSDEGRANLQAFRQALQRLAARACGLGERTEEGFGRIAVDLDVHQAAAWQSWQEKLRQLPSAAAEDLPSNWKEEVLQQALEFSEQIDKPAEKIAISQWQWLRHQAEVHSDPVRLKMSVTEELRRHAERLSGQSWKGVVEALIRELKEVENSAGPSQARKLAWMKEFLAALAVLQISKCRRRRDNETQRSDIPGP